MVRSLAVFMMILIGGAISPNFLSLQNPGFEYQVASADIEDDYTESILLSIDGFLTKTFAPTEESKGANGIFTVAIEAGDTLSTLAQRYGVKVRDLIINNSLPRNPILKPGQQLIIANGIIHKVAAKDTAASIAKAYGVDKEKVLASNEILEKDLVAGMKIVITGAKTPLPTYATPRRTGGSIANATSGATAPYVAIAGKLLFPTIGTYTQFFHPGHYAVDIANAQSPNVFAAETGIVKKSQCGWNGGYGCYIIIDHGGGMTTLYAHNRKLFVTVGEAVEKGQVISQMGNTGRVYGRTGIHLHFEVNINGVKRNPLAFF